MSLTPDDVRDVAAAVFGHKVAADLLESNGFPVHAKILRDISETKLLGFCSEYREGMGRPWVKGKWIYATDGRIALRMPADAADTVPVNPHWPNVDNVIKFTPSHLRTPHENAELFQGSGGSCYEIGGEIYNKATFDRIKELPGLVCFCNGSPSPDPMLFKFDGGDGAIMSLDRHSFTASDLSFWGVEVLAASNDWFVVE